MYFNSFSVYYHSEAMTLQNENSRINYDYDEWTALNYLYTAKGLKRLNSFYENAFFCTPQNIDNSDLQICKEDYDKVLKLKKKYAHLKLFNYEKSRIENYKQCLKYEKYFSNGNLDKYKLFIINTIPDFQKKDSNICIRFVCEKKSKSSYYPNQYSVYLESIQDIIAIPAGASKEAIKSIIEKYFLLASFQNISLSREVTGVRL